METQKTTFLQKIKNIKRSDLLNFCKLIWLKKCCCCIPLKIGVAFLIVIQMACLTPFTVYHRSKTSLEVAVFLMVLLTLGAISYMWAVVYERPNFLPTTIYFSIGTLIFHFAMLDVHYAQNQGTKKEKMVDQTFFMVNITGVTTYFYLVWMLHNTYYKMRLQLLRQQNSIEMMHHL